MILNMKNVSVWFDISIIASAEFAVQFELAPSRWAKDGRKLWKT